MIIISDHKATREIISPRSFSPPAVCSENKKNKNEEVTVELWIVISPSWCLLCITITFDSESYGFDF